MLAYVLALVIGLGSLAMYMAAFFLPEVHRKNDFIWSGVGLFYALVLWVCAGRITGGVLLGQLFSVALLGWFAWQTFTLRRALVSPNQQTPLPTELPPQLQNLVPAIQGLQQKFTGLFKKGKSDSEIVASAKAAAAAKQAETQPKEVAKPTPTVEIVDKRETEVAKPTPTEEVTTNEPETEGKPDTPEAPELVPPMPPAPELVEAAQKSASPDTETPNAVTPLEEFVPEVELAPPAEPIGRGDPEDRIIESDNTNAPNS
ncbi:MAG: Ycf66 family protein [Coleofasciculaceae cyanobacterium]